MRCGMIARKLGMSRVFTEDGGHIPVTVIEVRANRVVAQRTLERDGYTALQIGTEEAKVRHLTQSLRGHFATAGIEPQRKLVEFRVSEDAVLPVGATLSVEHFVAGQKVDVTGTSKGRGFAGAMKRHNFSGMRASHGVSVSHRAHGSTGNSQDPGRVWKGKKMAGHMGDKRITVQNLDVVATDAENGLLLLRGAVPGARQGWILVSDAVKAPPGDGVPFPGAFVTDEAAAESASADAKESGGDEA